MAHLEMPWFAFSIALGKVIFKSILCKAFRKLTKKDSFLWYHGMANRNLKQYSEVCCGFLFVVPFFGPIFAFPPEEKKLMGHRAYAEDLRLFDSGHFDTDQQSSGKWNGDSVLSQLISPSRSIWRAWVSPVEIKYILVVSILLCPSTSASFTMSRQDW